MSRSLSTFPFFKTVAGTQDNVFYITMEAQSQTLRRHRWPLFYYFANRNTVDLSLYESICVIRKGARDALNGKLSCFDSHLFFYAVKSIFFKSSSDRGPQEPQIVQILVTCVLCFSPSCEHLRHLQIASWHEHFGRRCLSTQVHECS